MAEAETEMPRSCLHLHEVRPGAPRLALGAHLTGHLDGAAEQQELFGQRGLARIGVRDDRKGARRAISGGRVGRLVMVSSMAGI
jgi:hypothetical protein